MAGSTQYDEVHCTSHTNVKTPNLGMRISSFRRNFIRQAERIHSRIPAIKKTPLSAIGIISLIALINVLVWAVCGVVLVWHPSLLYEMSANKNLQHFYPWVLRWLCYLRFNGQVWYGDRSLISSAAISYSLGLRHALDADHISVWSLTLIF